MTSAAEGALKRRQSSGKQFTRVCAAPQGVHVSNGDLGVPTGERDEQDAKSRGSATHDVKHQGRGVECGSYRAGQPVYYYVPVGALWVETRMSQEVYRWLRVYRPLPCQRLDHPYDTK